VEQPLRIAAVGSVRRGEQAADVPVERRDTEIQRVAAVRALRLLDTPREDRFERITRIAQQVLSVPIALVTLVDLDRQWAKSCVGLPEQNIARSSSFCSYAIATGRLLEVSDAAADPRFAHYPMVVGGPQIRFYAGQPVAAPSGFLVGTLCVMDRVPRRLTERQRAALRDLAAWVELEYTVLQANQWEQETERARRDFVSVVSHELRTPLTSIRGSLELIESGRFGELSPQVGRLVGIAAKNTDRLVRLAGDVVDLHQMRRGQLYLRLDKITLPEIVDQAVLAVQDVAERAAVSIDVSCDQVARVHVDADRLVQVVTNLLVNAVRVSPRGKSVSVACRMNGTRAKVAVRDHGPGVPQAQLDEIFEPFVQLETPSQRRTGSAGLGLAIASGIVEAHGGHLRAWPAEGGGSVFEVLLPTAGPESDVP
jgi:signal transduction histidine kinase